ncbi:TPA: hypothetical protein HA293_07060 [Candidatus Woesearchaeota archaeon]|nr:hypothetical protein [Candidatus Woesearchaeota archaeon]
MDIQAIFTHITKNFIIGVGKQTEINDWGGATIKGVKISLFDVSDFENPRRGRYI